MIKFRHLLDARGIQCEKLEPLNSRAGRYVKALETEKSLRPITLRIMKSSVSIFESFNSIRNNESFVHDNDIVDANEARFIFDNITSILRLLKSVESKDFGS